MSTRIILGDAAVRMAELDDGSLDAVVTDPPYGLSFMGKAWDHGVPDASYWREVLRVLKPGAHLVAFGGTRTYHRLTCAIEDAGFDIRDCLMWLTGQGFPKSLNLDKSPLVCRCSTIPYDHMDGAQASDSASEYDLRSVREADLSATLNADGQHRQVLLAGLSESGASTGRAASVDGHEGAEESCLEGRGHLLQDPRQLHGSQVCPSAGVGAANGPQRRVHHGASTHHGADVRVSPVEDGSGQSHRPQPEQQRPEEPRTLPDASGPQAGRGWPLCDGCGKPRIPSGYGTALKPAWEPIILARKPLAGTVAANVLAHGTGALNIDACRIEGAPRTTHADGNRRGTFPHSDDAWGNGHGLTMAGHPTGRWPANVVLDEEAAALLDEQSGNRPSSGTGSGGRGIGYGSGADQQRVFPTYDDTGGASRFFYTAKASPAERGAYNDHPTVKPLALMRWLCRLATPPGGTILDPFCGSGSTLIAAVREGFDAIGIDSDPHAVEIARRRLLEDGRMFADVEAS